MKRVRAFVVGIGRYFASAWDLDGASRNAVAITRWLRSNGVPSDRIHLFCDREALEAESCSWLDQEKLAIGPTKYDVLNTFSRVTLPELAQPGDRLFVFWSGHGMTKDEDRLFFCGDYSTRLNTSVFNASAFATALRGPAYRSYEARLIFADVCGNYADAVTAPAQGRLADLAAVDQIALFASMDGDYAEVDQRSGAFTEALLETLADFENTWPAQAPFLARLDAVLKMTNVHPFLVSWKSTDQDVRDRRAGRATIGYARSAYAMLQQHDTTAIQRVHYDRTLSRLRLNRIDGDETLHGMILALADLQDGGNGAPFGLVQFCARLAADPALGADGTRDIDAWIDAHGAGHRREAEEVLTAERQHRRLLIDIVHDAGRLSEVNFYVRFSNYVPDPSIPSQTRPIVTFDDLAAEVRRQVEDPRMEPRSGDLEIHFLVDLPQFDLPVHQIALSDGAPLGERYVCIVHFRSRAWMADAKEEVRRWRDWAVTLQDAVGDVVLNRFELAGQLPSAGLCYIGFPLGAAAMENAQLVRLNKLFRLGAPLVCWHHGDPAVAVGLPTVLQEMIKVAGVVKLPRELHTRRLRDCPVASDVTLLWDEPQFRPFTAMKGAGR